MRTSNISKVLYFWLKQPPCMSNIVTVYHITSDDKPVFSAGFSHSGFSHRLASDVEAFEINRDLAQNFEYSTPFYEYGQIVDNSPGCNSKSSLSLTSLTK